MQKITKVNGKVLASIIVKEVKSLYPSVKDRELNESIHNALKNSDAIRGTNMYFRSRNQLVLTSELEILGYYPKLVVESAVEYVSNYNLLYMTSGIISSITKHAYESARSNYINTIELEAIKSHSTVAGEWF